jgi:hypothetical protein
MGEGELVDPDLTGVRRLLQVDASIVVSSLSAARWAIPARRAMPRRRSTERQPLSTAARTYGSGASTLRERLLRCRLA